MITSETENIFRTLSETAPVGIFLNDAENKCVFANERIFTILGMSREDSLDDGWMRALHPDDAARVVQAWTATIAGQKDFREEYRFVHADGTIVWVYCEAKVFRLPTGEIDGYVGTLVDITDRKKQEDRQRRLACELDHRVKNTLASILALSKQTLNRAQSLEDFDRDFTLRLMALSRMHESLASRCWSGMSLVEALHLIVIPHAASPNRVSIECDDVALPASLATPICMTLHELTTNAVRHGSLGTGEGSVSISCALYDDTLAMDWKEEGGPAVAPQPVEGLGMRLIKGFIRHEIQGEVAFDFTSGGLQCSIRAPLDESRALRLAA